MTTCKGAARRGRKVVRGLCAMSLVWAASGPTVWAQEGAAAAKQDSNVVQTFYFKNVSLQNDGNELFTALRNLLDPHDKMAFVPSQNAMSVSASPEQLVLVQKILNDLDRPKKAYRLAYTITEMDGGKRIGVQHFALIAVTGVRTTLKNGSRVPIVTGASAPGTSPQNTQVTYIDVGLNIDASLDELPIGARLRSKVEQSSVAEERSGVGAQDPVVRQTTIEGTSFLIAGKPLLLGSVDISGSTRHLDVEVVMEAVR